jgi:predicted dehydrogenase
MTLRVAVIGLGKQSVENHLPALLASDQFQLAAVVDIDAEKVQQIATRYAVPGFTSLEDLLAHVSIEVAILAIPHSSYLSAIASLARRGIHIIKEKPFATSWEEAVDLQSIIREHHIYLGVTMQRRFNPVFQAFHHLKNFIGKIYSVEGKYTLNIAELDKGWRASKSIAGGGALLDMGYHFIDLLVWYFGIPSSVNARITRGNRPGQVYDVEDTVHLLCDYQMEGYSSEEKLLASVIISRVYPQKEESLIVYGTKGIIKLNQACIQRLDSQGREIEKLERSGGWPSTAINQLDFFASQIHQFCGGTSSSLHEHLAHNAIIQAAYASDRVGHSCSPFVYLEHLSPEQLVSQ